MSRSAVLVVLAALVPKFNRGACTAVLGVHNSACAVELGGPSGAGIVSKVITAVLETALAVSAPEG